jgi:hypothetical protein
MPKSRVETVAQVVEHVQLDRLRLRVERRLVGREDALQVRLDDGYFAFGLT